MHFVCEMNEKKENQQTNNPLDDLISVYFSIYSFELRETQNAL